MKINITDLEFIMRLAIIFTNNFLVYKVIYIVPETADGAFIAITFSIIAWIITFKLCKSFDIIKIFNGDR